MTEKQIILIVKKSLKVRKINQKSSSENIEKWDSLGHLSIMVKLDKETKGKSSTIDLSSCTSIKKLSKALSKI
jgi:acyl carrier protein